MMWIQFQEKTEKNPHHQQYQQKHHLLVIVMKKPLIQIKLVGKNRKQMRYKILPAPTEGATENVEEGFHC